MARKKVMTAQLPPTPCPAEMRDEVVTLAEKEEVSIADIIRSALSLFLSTKVSKTDNIVCLLDKETV
jgi:hypothetical protein